MEFKKQEREFELRRLEIKSTRGADTGRSSSLGSGQCVKGLKLPPFEEGKDDMDAYLQRFERYAIAQKWEEGIWATHLSVLLKGNALSVYALMPASQALDYNSLKAALLKRYDMTEEGFKRKFRSCRPESTETFQQFSVRLGGYFDRWVDMSEVTKDYASLSDLVLRDQFLYICSRDLSLFLKERIPHSLDDMVALADQFKEARRTSALSLTGQERNSGNSTKQVGSGFQQNQHAGSHKSQSADKEHVAKNYE